MPPLLQTPGPIRDLLLVAAQAIVVIVLFWLAWGILHELLSRVVPAGKARVAALRTTRVLVIVLFVITLLTVAIVDAVLLWGSGDLTGGLLATYGRLPSGFAEDAALLAGEWLALALGTGLVVWLLRRLLGRLRVRARGWERLKENDAAVDAFFGFLATAVTVSLWLLGLALALSLVPATSPASALAYTLLRVFLIFAAALLLVRATAAIVATLDALSIRFAGPTSPFRLYSELRSLVPLLRRCLEAAIWLAAVSLILLQIGPVANLAEWGPRLILVVAIFFLARVAAEVVTLLIRALGARGDELTDLERQQRATLVPLVASLGRLLVHFVAFVLGLSVLGLNPLPLLAGAGILGVVVGFGAQPVINDLVSGFFVLAESQFLVGDYIEVGASRGVVEAINLRTTTLRDPGGQLHILRNGQLTGVVNYSKRYTFAVVEITVPYEADLQATVGALETAGERLRSEQPDVLERTVVEGLEKLEGTGLTLRTKTKVRPGSHGQVAREYRRLLLEELRQARIAPYAPNTPAAS
jgi:small-conductance mechanosensitive channel